ncbi:phage scaffolding protein [uncultured Staphylococcus sp.]|uniref:phage scaffolding protein n=1 Tax=uncultured Staphylococcus sp. TaxID=189668 RepID=UPI0025D36923|nr:phage scaffolding protein [uncultured Staphylococcus sp.]
MELKALLKQFKDGEIDEQKVVDAIDETKSNMVPRSRLNDKNEEIKELKAELESRDKQIVELEHSVKNDSELHKELEEIKQQNTEWASKYQESQLNNAIKLAVAKDANDANDILAFVNRDKLELTDDGSVKGLDDEVKRLKQDKSYLFAPTKPKGVTPHDGDNPTGGITKEQFQKMTADERTDLYLTNREVYDKLKE